MSSDERSPKRQRLSSPSPASTPTETKTTPFAQHPNTPPPSVHMSPSWNSQPLPGLGMVGNGNGSGAGGANFPTPPSPATGGYQSQSIAQSVGSEGGSARQTPATEAETQDTEMSGAGGGDGDGDVSMSEDGEHRRTDHERTGEGEDADATPSLPTALGLYTLPTKPIARSAPHPAQNLFDLYSLRSIQSSVARKDPLTGEKINKLRKSYEGKVKDLGLEGRNKASKNEKELEGLVDPEWDIIVPDGRSYWAAQREHVDFSERGVGTIEEMLGKALSSLRPGKLPKAEDLQWRNSLGLDDTSLIKPAPSTSTATLPAKTAANHFLSKTAPTAAAQRSAPASPRATGLGIAARPERPGKKRRYDDASWEGYDEDGYSTGDGGGRRGSGGKRQKRKDFPSASSTTTSPAFSPNGGGGAVGVRSS